MIMKKATGAGILAVCISLLAGCGFIAPSQGHVARQMAKKYGERFEYIDNDEETSQYRYRTSQMATNEKIAVSYREDVLKDEYASYLLQYDEAEYISKYFDKFLLSIRFIQQFDIFRVTLMPIAHWMIYMKQIQI